MNDFDYDVLQKKRIARNAKYQKKGSRSKGCKLPGDYLTKAEKAKLSETKVSIKLRSPITWEQFKECSTPLKREWLEWVRDEFNAGAATVAQDLWHLERSYLTQYIRRHEPTLTDIFADHRRQKYDIRERWLAWCAGEQVEEKNANAQEPPEQEPENAPNPEPALAPMPAAKVVSGAFTVSGTADEALELLRMMFRDDHRAGTFTLTYTYEEDDNELA